MRERDVPAPRVIVTGSAEETEALGRVLGGRLQIPGVVLLRGSLGAGKTTLARGIAVGLGLADPAAVTSPSFTLVNVYEGRCPIYHVDLYRLEGERDLYSIGLDEFMGTLGVTIVEWSERLKSPPGDAVLVEIDVEDGDRRKILVRAHPSEPVRQSRKRGSARGARLRSGNK